jgi:hypothetical protein
MDAADKADKVRNGIISHLNFKGDEDGRLLELANCYRSLRPGLTVKAAIRNYLLENLPLEIKRLSSSGTPMAGGQSGA